MMKAQVTQLLILGESGQLATELRSLEWPAGWKVTMAGRSRVDLADERSLSELVTGLRPAIIVNAAAHTAVDRAESEPDLAWRINAEAPALLARLAGELGSRLIHVSTDYVFDGRLAGRGYREEDPTGPVSVYGASKRAGETGILETGSDALILRTAWVYSPHGQNFVKTMMRLAAERPELRVVADQRGSPTAAIDIARAIRDLASHPVRGILHYTGAGETSWYGFAMEIFAVLAAHGRPIPALMPIATADYPTPARRPANSVLDCSRYDALGLAPRPSWQAALATCIDRLVRG